MVSMVTAVKLVIALASLYSPVKKLVDLFVSLYVQSEIGRMEKAHADGIKKAVSEQDQRDAEKSIGSPTAGLPSGIAGTEIRDSLPGVKP